MHRSGPDAHALALLRQAMLVIWRETVLSRLEAAYGVTCQGLPKVA